MNTFPIQEVRYRSWLLIIGAALLVSCTTQDAPSPSGQDASERARAEEELRAAIIRPETKPAVGGHAKGGSSDSGGQSRAKSIAAEAGRAAVAAVKLPKMSSDGYRVLDWLELMSKEDLDALEHPERAPQIQHVGNKRSKQTGSSKVVDTLDGQRAQIPGFVVPIETDDRGNMTEFFLVPYYGACIHVPPPPPNQIVYVRLAAGIPQPSLWDPFWLKGTMRTTGVSNRIAGAAYSMSAALLVPWKGDP